MSLIKELEHLIISYEDIKEATENFKTEIGSGGYGHVYEGKLSLSGVGTINVAVKKFDTVYGNGRKEFLTEIQLLSRYEHQNIVSLVGFCEEPHHEKFLIYVHAENGSLDKHLKPGCPLTWKQRINICVDAARGLDHLHNHVVQDEIVFHRDIKSGNILLDINWRAMIADFGLSKIGRASENIITYPTGTPGYCDPAYIDTSMLFKEADIYSFGVVLVEVLCGRLCSTYVNIRETFAKWAQRHYEDNKLNLIIDDSLKINENQYSINCFADIAFQCLQLDPKQRPSMGVVLQNLQEALVLQEIEETHGSYENWKLRKLVEEQEKKTMYWIADVKANGTPIPLRVRVINKWKTHNTYQELCYLLVDRHGDAIEAVANPSKEAKLDLKLKINLCYTITGYVAVSSRKFKKVVPHNASIRLGYTAVISPLCDPDIPLCFYDFATYEVLASRKSNPNPLTDYIGRVETVSDPLIRAGKKVLKVKIQDEWENVIEITFWDETLFPYKREEAVGKVLAVTATLVSEYMKNLQLESTEATTAVLNPSIPNLQSYIDRFGQLKTPESIQESQTVLRIAEIQRKYKQDPTHTRFACKARVIEITMNRRWYYATCPECRGIVFPRNDTPPCFICEDHGRVQNPKLMYCVNTIIADESSDSKAVFFNDAITQMVDKSCYDMVINDGYSNAEIIPPEISEIQGKTAIFEVTMKNNRTMTINKATIQQIITPLTPNPKTRTTKRKLQLSQEDETSKRRKKKVIGRDQKMDVI